MIRSLIVRQTTVALERRVRAILAARRCGFRYDERDAALDVVVERIWRDIAPSEDEKSDEPEDAATNADGSELRTFPFRLVGADA